MRGGRTLSLRIIVTPWSLLRSSAHSRLWQRQPPRRQQRQPSYSTTQRSKSRKSSKCSRGSSLTALSRWRCSRMWSSRMGHSAAIEALDTTTTPAAGGQVGRASCLLARLQWQAAGGGTYRRARCRMRASSRRGRRRRASGPSRPQTRAGRGALWRNGPSAGPPPSP
jgi:hypothetical protein